MIAGFAALLFAHLLADFLFQTGGMVRRKQEPQVLALHALIVLVTAAVVTGRYDAPQLLALALAHLAIDAVKIHGPWKHGLTPFLVDQAAHLVTLVAVALWVPDLWQAGLWAGWPVLLPAMTLAGGLLLATRAGGFAVGILMAPYRDAPLPRGLRNGGLLIGQLERLLIFLLLLAGQAAAIGFLIAAKSILRFNVVTGPTTGETDEAAEAAGPGDQSAAEYVIIGTLASFAWALGASYGTLSLLHALAPLAELPFRP